MMNKIISSSFFFILCFSAGNIINADSNTDIDIVYNRKLEIPYKIDSNAEAVQCYYITNSAMYAGTSSGLYFSSDTGKTWKLFNDSLKEAYIFSIFVDKDETVYLGTSRGFMVFSGKLKQWIINEPDIKANSICKYKNTVIIGSVNNKW